MSTINRVVKVLLLHNEYKQRGGEDSVVTQEASLLERHGNLTRLVKVSNGDMIGWLSEVRAALDAIFSLRSYFFVRKLIKNLRPDVVHVHNFFPLLSPSVFYACQAEGVPVVFTLHNYRIVCPTSLLMHDGVVTDRSLFEGPWWALRHRVYRNSWIGTFVLCLMISVHKRLGTWQRAVDCSIALTEFGKKKFLLAGLPEDRLRVKPNFAEINLIDRSRIRSGLLYVGRISPEKGIGDILSAAVLPGGSILREELRLAGVGQLLNSARSAGFKCWGAMASDEVHRSMAGAIALLVPSIWYEGFPMVVVEAYASGLPVIASRIGSLAELVDDGVTGLLFEPHNPADLLSKVRWALEHPAQMGQMGRNARQVYEERYAPEANYRQLMAIYQDVIDKKSETQGDIGTRPLK